MSEDGSPAARIGVRELRQNLSVYLDRVKDGEALDVTERGHVVARLVPTRGDDESMYLRLIDEGRIKPARRPPTANLGLPPPAAGPPLSVVLREARDEDDR